MSRDDPDEIVAISSRIVLYVCDAKAAKGHRFYERYEFEAFSEQPQRLYLSMNSIEQSGLRMADGTH